MGHIAKIPQQRIRAGEGHPTFVKLEQLFDFMDSIGLELEFYRGKVFVIDRERQNDKDWEIRDIINDEFLTEFPCDHGEYKITQNVNVSPRSAQQAVSHNEKSK